MTIKAPTPTPSPIAAYCERLNAVFSEEYEDVDKWGEEARLYGDGEDYHAAAIVPLRDMYDLFQTKSGNTPLSEGEEERERAMCELSETFAALAFEGMSGDTIVELSYSGCH